MLSRYFANAQSAINRVAGVDVIYRRGDSWARVRATPGESEFPADGLDQVVETRSRDFIVEACQVRFGDADPVTPQRGDTIEETVGSTVHVYELRPPVKGREVWRYTDHGRRWLRVHTKLKGAPEPRQ